MSNKEHLFLNKQRWTQIKTKYDVSFLKPYWESDETKVMRDGNPLPVQSTNNHMVLKKPILQV